MKYFALLLVISICGALADSDSDSGSGSKERRHRRHRNHREPIRRETQYVPVYVHQQPQVYREPVYVHTPAVVHHEPYVHHEPVYVHHPEDDHHEHDVHDETPNSWVDNGVMKERLSWKAMDVKYAGNNERKAAMKAGNYVAENNVPTGIDVWQNKLFITIPRHQSGVHTTLGYVDLNSKTQSPAVIPYPSLAANEASNNNQCTNIISVDRAARVDKFNRLWVVDSGIENSVQICPPRIHVFDLKTNKKLRMFRIPDNVWGSSSRFVNAVVDADDHVNAYLYIADQRGIMVYSWAENNAWRFNHVSFGVDPHATDFTVGGVHFTMNDAGVSGLALSPRQADGFKTLYYHSLSSLNEGSVSTRVLRNKMRVANSGNEFRVIGQRTQRSSTEVMASNGIMYFNVVDRNGVACWNSRNSFQSENFKMVGQDDEKYIFPSDSVIDSNNNLWVLTNRQPVQMHGHLDLKDTNFRVMSAPVSQLDRCN